MKKNKCTKRCLILSMALLIGNTAFTAQAKAENVKAAGTGDQGVPAFRSREIMDWVYNQKKQ